MVTALLHLILAATPAPVAAGPTPPPSIRVEERVEVSRIVIDARVVDARGQPVRGLAPTDFQAFIDGVPARIEAVEWIDADAPYSDGPTPADAAIAGVQAAPAGRLVVLFFQTDFNRYRLPGLMRMRARAVELARSFPARDRIAVVSFDARLKLRHDFTRDRVKVEEALSRAILYAPDDPFTPEDEFSLAPRLDQATARAATSPEKALLAVGRALAALPGAKSLVWAGWGIGRKAGAWVVLESAWEEARRVMTAARVTVFALDVTDADFHDLELGLRQVAAETGGFYAKTHEFPTQALDRLKGAFAGSYQFVVVRPELPHGDHSMVITLAGKGGEILAHSMYHD